MVPPLGGPVSCVWKGREELAPESLYLSQLLRCRVTDAAGAPVGEVTDVVARHEGLFPTVVALVVRPLGARGGGRRVAWNSVAAVGDGQVTLRVSGDQISEYPSAGDEILLGAEVLDKQLVDTHGRRVVKVNDLKLVLARNELRVLGVDVGVRGILRRLGAEAATDTLLRALRRSLPEALIPWNYVQSVPARGANVRLSVPYSRLERLHPADIGRILSQLPAEELAATVQHFSDETLAEAMGDLEAPVQRTILEGLDKERVSDILERMAPDEATDLLQDLPEERREELLT
ncbi:MAG: hypothetical protein QHJ73_09265, partial [Armatimonadota bacterium]|nr:hypothetical protein [Armatimonadota bacterium]